MEPHTALQPALLAHKARSNSGPTVAQRWRVTQNSAKTREKRPIPPLDDARLNEMALRYVGRYATTRAKLAAYLHRKLRERGWAGDRPADPEAIVARMAELRYVDDAGFAVMKGAALGRRGYGARRIGEALRAAGVEEPDRAEAEDEAASGKWATAQAFARRKRIGPFAREPADRDIREKQIAAFLRAGHDFATARAWVNAEPGEMPEEG
ncbi:RecX family transcriptional regulator [Sphingobium phenoxybenzoativorans]|uniref:RecX family transcriptional regulator n=2 Tax=Sphingobium phenoxybenzoativorans TaxID=1592790 RepID=A0A975Q0Z6_9SPHN|nr:RecX family transcriptional regulator [Sphingobium phenoxybenzoativorans]